MKIVVSAQGKNLEASASPVFGRCPTYVFADTETLEFEAIPNAAMDQAGGAGIQAAQFVVNQGAQAVLSGNLGPNAFGVLQAAGVPGYLVREGTVRQAVEFHLAGELRPMAGANGSAESPRSVAGHAGMGMGRGMGGRRGMGMGRGMQPAIPIQPEPQAAGGSEMAELREMLKDSRQQLAETMEKIEELEKEG